jgi:hypothetical protein
VPERVVDDLEPVEVAEEDGEDVAGALGACQRVRQAIDEQEAVRQSGEGVVRRLRR